MNIDAIKNIAEIIGSVIAGIGLLSAGIGYCYSQFKTGKSAATKDSLESQNELTQYLRDQIDGYKEIAKEQNSKISNMEKQIASMQAIISEKDSTIKKYLDILQNRNPELDQFMQESRQKWQDQLNFISQILDAMKNINEHMDVQKKDIKIQATVTQK